MEVKNANKKCKAYALKDLLSGLDALHQGLCTSLNQITTTWITTYRFIDNVISSGTHIVVAPLSAFNPRSGSVSVWIVAISLRIHFTPYLAKHLTILLAQF